MCKFDNSSAHFARRCLLFLSFFLLLNCALTQVSENKKLIRNVKSWKKGEILDRRRRDNQNETKVDTAEPVSGTVVRTVSKKCRCGISVQPIQSGGSSPTKLRIVGGTEVQKYSKPWMAALVTRSNFNHFCGGTIIDNLHILTAAHCVYKLRVSSFLVIVGLHDKFDYHELTEGAYSVNNVIIHPNFNPETVDNDIALLQLHHVLEFSDIVRPACLPLTNADFTGVYATVTGWGAIVDGGGTSKTLQEVTLPVISNSECRKVNHDISDNMLCAGERQGGRDACQGDSGGPMVYETDNRWFLIGVVSWGNGCAQPNQPGVYTNVSRYIAWIYQSTQDGVYCW